MPDRFGAKSRQLIVFPYTINTQGVANLCRKSLKPRLLAKCVRLLKLAEIIDFTDFLCGDNMNPFLI